MKKIALLTLCFSFSAPLTYAFKVDTHIWIGQQVINDLADDGKLSFNINNKTINVLIANDVKNAVLNNKSDYLMGNIGPDAVPDVVIGQTVIHPGLVDEAHNRIGWQTNDWMDHLLKSSTKNDSGKAFVYGFLGHAGSDVFAHTYVNQYAGDSFDLKDETLVEQRHFILESYISKYTPPLKNHLGQPLGTPWNQVALDDVYAEFIRDSLIFNKDAQEQYKKSPSASHLLAYYEFRQAIDKLAESGIWREIDIIVAQIVASYFDIELSHDEAGAIVDEAQKVVDLANKGSEEIQDFTNKIYDRANKYDDQVFSNLSVAVEGMQTAEQNFLAAHQNLRRKLAELQPLKSCPKINTCTGGVIVPTALSPTPKLKIGSVLDPIGVTSGSINPIKIFDPIGSSLGVYEYADFILDPASVADINIGFGCKLVTDPVCKLSLETVSKTNDLILDAADKLESELLNKKDDLIAKTNQVRDEVKIAADSVHRVQNGLIDLQQMLTADVSPIQSLLRGWRSDVDKAMTAYVKASSQSIINTMDPNQSAMDPMVKWFECYHLQIIGAPSAVSGCEFKDAVMNLKQSLENILVLIDEATSVGNMIGVPTHAQIIELRDQLIDEIIEKLKAKVADKIEDLLPSEIQEIVQLMDQPITDAVLNQYYTKAEIITPAKGLIMIPDMVDRVKAEMKIGASNSFDPAQFPPIYNAIVLAKLALLDRVAFEEIARVSGSKDYVNYTTGLLNIVAPAFASIDGNHQWMMTAPPMPRSTGIYNTQKISYASTDGFLLWKGDMRDTLFRSIFIGPLSAGIDAPELLGKSVLLKDNYPYKVCNAYPFPDSVDDKTCTAIMLMPAVRLMQ